MSNREKLLLVGPMARRCRVPVRWLKAEAEAGRIPCLRAGRVFLFNPTAVEKSLAKRAARAAGAAGPAGGEGGGGGTADDE